MPPGAQLSLPDAVRLRDRATILARQLYATPDGAGPAMADQQVAALLQSLSIDPGALPAELPHQAAPAEWAALWEGQAARGRPPEPLVGADVAAAHAHAAAAHAAAVGAGAGPAAWDGIWQQQQQQQQMPRPASTGWADEFAVQRQQQRQGPDAWAEEFQQQEGGAASDWVQGFTEEQEAAAGTRHGSSAATSADAQATSARLVAALTADGDPKMKNSKFLQFLSKMSKGELMFEDNKVCAAAGVAGSGMWWWWCWCVVVVLAVASACVNEPGVLKF
jgi:peroxin-5